MKSCIYSAKLAFIASLAFLCSCKSFRIQTFLKADENLNAEVFEEAYSKAAKNYTIQELDYIAVSIYTNKGERLIDPNKEFAIGTSPSIQNFQQNNRFQNQQQLGNQNANTSFYRPLDMNNMPPRSYLIDSKGNAHLPLVGKVKLSGLSLSQTDSLLATLYSEWYTDPFVVTQYLNKRVILMGAMGDRVIPLNNEHMTLLEILAISGTFQKDALPNKIRIIRGDLKNPSVQLIDISTIEGMKKANLQLQHLDVIYVEPRRKLDNQSLRDVSVFVSLFTSLITLYLLIANLNK